MSQDQTARLLGAYLEAYPGWLADFEAVDEAGLPPQSWLPEFQIMRELNLIEEVSGQIVRLPGSGARQVPCRITDAGAVALRDWKEQHGEEGTD